MAVGQIFRKLYKRSKDMSIFLAGVYRLFKARKWFVQHPSTFSFSHLAKTTSGSDRPVFNESAKAVNMARTKSPTRHR